MRNAQIMRRSVVLGGAGLLAATCLPSGAYASAKPTRIVVAYQPGDANSQGIIKQMGWFDEVDGVKVEYKDFNSGADVYRAMASGAIDLGLIGNAPFAIAVTQNAPYQAVWWYDIGTTGEGLVVRKSANIQRIADLKGRSVATPFGSTADYMLHGTLQTAGVTSGVKLLNMSPQSILAAWRRNDIDAVYIWEPVLSELVKLGGVTLAEDKDILKNGYVAGDLGVVRTAFLQEHPDVVRTWMKANIRAMDMIRNNSAEAKSAASKAYGVSVSEIDEDFAGDMFPLGSEQLEPTYLGGTGEQLYHIAQLLAADGLIPKAAAESVYKSAVSLEPLKDALAH